MLGGNTLDHYITAPDSSFEIWDPQGTGVDTAVFHSGTQGRVPGSTLHNPDQVASQEEHHGLTDRLEMKEVFGVLEVAGGQSSQTGVGKKKVGQIQIQEGHHVELEGPVEEAGVELEVDGQGGRCESDNSWVGCWRVVGG